MLGGNSAFKQEHKLTSSTRHLSLVSLELVAMKSETATHMFSPQIAVENVSFKLNIKVTTDQHSGTVPLYLYSNFIIMPTLS